MSTRPRLLTRPPRLDHALARPRLAELAGDRRLVVIAAPAGWGATTAAAQLAGDGVRWARLAPGFAGPTDAVAMLSGNDVDDGPLLSLADVLLESLEAAPASAVIDDLDAADTGDVERLLAEVVELVPDGTQVIVTTAARPATLLGLVRPTDVALLDAEALAFTDDEAGQLLALHGADATRGPAWNATMRGWATGLLAGATAPDADPAQRRGDLLRSAAVGDQRVRQLMSVAAVVPYVTDELLTPLAEIGAVDGTDDAASVAKLAATAPLLVDHDGMVRLDSAIAAELAAELDPSWTAMVRATVATHIADHDPTTAIDLFLDGGAPERAADVLDAHLSAIGVERALTWLYRMPDELRRRFPPVLAAGQATVEVDTALASALLRVEVAGDARARREALLALGSVEAYRGELGAAANAYEAALRASDDPDFDARVAGQLADTRFWLGDVAGARAALERSADSALTRWIAAQIAVVDGEVPAPAAGDAPLDLAVNALAALVAGDDAASGLIEAAYAAADGGDDLTASGPLLAWGLLAAGRRDEAVAIAEELERRLGPAHRLGRVHGAVIRERASRGVDRSTHERDERRLRDLRATGFAMVERLADAVLTAHELEDSTAAIADGGDAAVVVALLGTHEVRLASGVVGRSAWKSKKALDVLSVLALAGDGGRRREEVIEAVWPGRPPDKGRTLLRTALSEIRRTLEPGRPAGEPSAYVSSVEDRLVLDGTTDLDVATMNISDAPGDAFVVLAAGVAPEVMATEWGAELVGVVERHSVDAASRVANGASPADEQIAALEFLRVAEPWSRGHVDALIELHCAAGDDAAATAVERAWFADD
ncbi:MAG: hypothetical protein AAFY28_03025 [Actinomycetota bacterium]